MSLKKSLKRKGQVTIEYMLLATISIVGFLASNLFYSMYAHTEEHVTSYLEAVDGAFVEIASALEQGDLHRKMKGQPSSEGFKRLN